MKPDKDKIYLKTGDTKPRKME